MPPRSAIFHEAGQVYHADTCEPVRAAAASGRIRLHAVTHGPYPGRPLPPGLLPQVRTAGYWDADAAQTWGLGYHRNEGIELTYVARGRLAFAVGRREYDLRRGHLTITRPWQEHRVGDPNLAANRLFWLILDVGVRRPNQAWHWPDWMILSAAELARLTSLLRHNERAVWPADDAVARCFEEIGALVERPNLRLLRTQLALRINSLMLALMEMLRRRDIPLDYTLTSTHRAVELFLADLPRRLDHPWTVDAMADQCGLARSRFTHYCRLITNASPADYLARCRVEAARSMLAAAPQRSITTIAQACGFSSSQYFATVFRSLTGTTPSAARAEAGGG